MGTCCRPAAPGAFGEPQHAQMRTPTSADCRLDEGTLRLRSGQALPLHAHFFLSNFTNSGSLDNAAEYFSHNRCSTAGAPLTIAPASTSPATPLCGVTIAPSPTLQCRS